MVLLVGLGNPGPQYTFTRHNIGFMVIDALSHIWSAPQFKSEHKALTAKINIEGQPALLVKPQTYMNLSGEAVQALMTYYQIPKEKLLVIHDEVDIPFATIRYQSNRSPGGHNGIKSVHQHIGSEYDRLRLGVGRSPNPNIETSDHVLQNFSKDEQQVLPDFLGHACDSIEVYVKSGLQKAASQFNTSAAGTTVPAKE